jgi:hypothetical protein
MSNEEPGALAWPIKGKGDQVFGVPKQDAPKPIEYRALPSGGALRLSAPTVILVGARAPGFELCLLPDLAMTQNEPAQMPRPTAWAFSPVHYRQVSR